MWIFVGEESKKKRRRTDVANAPAPPAIHIIEFFVVNFEWGLEDWWKLLGLKCFNPLLRHFENILWIIVYIICIRVRSRYLLCDFDVVDIVCVKVCDEDDTWLAWWWWSSPTFLSERAVLYICNIGYNKQEAKQQQQQQQETKTTLGGLLNDPPATFLPEPSYMFVTLDIINKKQNNNNKKLLFFPNSGRHAYYIYRLLI